MSYDDKTFNQLKGEFIRSFQTQNGKCLEPTEKCTCAPINSHSIQNNRILNQLAVDNHVYALKIDLSKLPQNNSNKHLKIDFEKISRHKATVFNGLCSKHDTEIFKPIDVQDLNVNNVEQSFLFTYRSVLQELAVLIESAVRSQGLYLKKVDMGLLPSNTPCAEGLLAVQMMMNAYEWYEIKKEFDLAYLNQDYNFLFNTHIILDEPAPFAVSSIFTPIEMSTKPKEEQTFSEIERIAVNIFPYKEQTYVIFSCMRKDMICMERYVQDIFLSKGAYQKYLLSKLVLRNCSNIAFSPDFVENLTAKQRQTIANFFYKTIYTDDINFEDKDIYLFSQV